MIKVSEAGDKGCTIEIYGNAEIVAQQYVSLTATLNDKYPAILLRASKLLEEITNDKTDINNN